MLATKAMGGIIVTERRTFHTVGGKSCDWKFDGGSLSETSPVCNLILFILRRSFVEITENHFCHGWFIVIRLEVEIINLSE
ncbi:hypothetical protein ALC56_09311 [Trachymyrmex septentrionalis]|uniref:Uncharacterized protein n=1 Tax=Trachymyrmex septentrionalis TaxID=34720 RepID=A0A195F7I8_9HYME|nr:hypothetical protein ALC56_09311 [Trachymyrmex septentrionalis]